MRRRAAGRGGEMAFAPANDGNEKLQSVIENFSKLTAVICALGHPIRFTSIRKINAYRFERKKLESDI